MWSEWPTSLLHAAPIAKLLALANGRRIRDRLIGVERFGNGLREERSFAKETGLHGGLERLDLLKEILELLLIVLDELEPLSLLLDAVVEPLQITPAGELELFLLGLRELARPFDLLDLKLQKAAWSRALALPAFWTFPKTRLVETSRRPP